MRIKRLFSAFTVLTMLSSIGTLSPSVTASAETSGTVVCLDTTENLDTDNYEDLEYEAEIMDETEAFLTSFSANSEGLSYSYTLTGNTENIDAYLAVYDSENRLKYLSENESSGAAYGDFTGCTPKLMVWGDSQRPAMNAVTEVSEPTIIYYNIDSFDGETFKYYQDGTNKTIRLDTSSLTIRYNGRAVRNNVTLSVEITNDEGNSIHVVKECTPTEALLEWLNPESHNFIYGTIKFIDAGSTGKYNIVDIYDYDTIVANYVPSHSDYSIWDKTMTGNYLILDPNRIDYDFIITKSGSQIETTSISAGDVINYAKSLEDDDYHYTVYDTAKSVKGTITSLNIDDKADDKTVSIDNVEYRITDRFLAYMTKKEHVTLKTGLTITAYLDMFGALEWGTVSTTYYPYAYVIDAAQDGDECYLRMFAPTDGSITSFSSSTSYSVKYYKIADSTKLNSTESSPEEILTHLADNAAAANLDTQIPGADIITTGYNQLVRVLLSGSEITDIVTFDAGYDGCINSDTSKLVRFKAMNTNTKYYVTSSSVKNTSSSSGMTMYSIETTTPLFVIPRDRYDTDSYSLKSAITANSMYSGNAYYIDAYDVDNWKFPACLLVYNTSFKSGKEITYSTAYSLICDEIGQEVDDDGNVADKLYTYNSETIKSAATIAASPENAFSRLGKGDIVLVGSNRDKELDTYMQVQDYDEIKSILSGKPVIVTDYDGNEKYELFNWTAEQEQTEENNWQKYKFDFRYPKAVVTDLDRYWVTGGNYTGIASRAFMCNVLRVIDSHNLIYVTQSGLDESGCVPSDYMEIKISSSTKIIRYDPLEDKFTPYAEGTADTPFAITDLREAEYCGLGCSKILLTYVSGSTAASTATPIANLIVIYQ